ncbi:hypothetical protein AB0L06_06935 [Spirillospora sp. NPDC052269]
MNVQASGTGSGGHGGGAQTGAQTGEQRDLFTAVEENVRELVVSPWWASAPPQQRAEQIVARMLWGAGEWWLYGAWGRWYRCGLDGSWHPCPPPSDPASRNAAMPAPRGAGNPPVPPQLFPTGPDLSAGRMVSAGFLGPVPDTAVVARISQALTTALAVDPAQFQQHDPMFQPGTPSTVAAAWGALLWCAGAPVALTEHPLIESFVPFLTTPADRLHWMMPPDFSTLAGYYASRLVMGDGAGAAHVVRVMYEVAAGLTGDERFRPGADALAAVTAASLRLVPQDLATARYGQQAVLAEWRRRCPAEHAIPMMRDAAPGEHLRLALYDLQRTVSDLAGDGLPGMGGMPGAPGTMPGMAVPGMTAGTSAAGRRHDAVRRAGVAVLAADLQAAPNVLPALHRWLDPDSMRTLQALLTDPGHPLRALWPREGRLPDVLRGDSEALSSLLVTTYSLGLTWCRLAQVTPPPTGFAMPQAIAAELMSPALHTPPSTDELSAWDIIKAARAHLAAQREPSQSPEGTPDPPAGPVAGGTPPGPPGSAPGSVPPGAGPDGGAPPPPPPGPGGASPASAGGAPVSDPSGAAFGSVGVPPASGGPSAGPGAAPFGSAGASPSGDPSGAAGAAAHGSLGAPPRIPPPPAPLADPAAAPGGAAFGSPGASAGASAPAYAAPVPPPGVGAGPGVPGQGLPQAAPVPGAAGPDNAGAPGAAPPTVLSPGAAPATALSPGLGVAPGTPGADPQAGGWASPSAGPAPAAPAGGAPGGGFQQGVTTADPAYRMPPAGPAAPPPGPPPGPPGGGVPGWSADPEATQLDPGGGRSATPGPGRPSGAATPDASRPAVHTGGAFSGPAPSGGAWAADATTAYAPPPAGGSAPATALSAGAGGSWGVDATTADAGAQAVLPPPPAPVSEPPPPVPQAPALPQGPQIAEAYGIRFLCGADDIERVVTEVRRRGKWARRLRGQEVSSASAPGLLLIGEPSSGQRRLARMAARALAEVEAGSGEVRTVHVEEVAAKGPEGLAELLASHAGHVLLLDGLDRLVLDEPRGPGFSAALARARLEGVSDTALVGTCAPARVGELSAAAPELVTDLRAVRLPDLSQPREREALLRLLAEERRLRVGEDAWTVVRRDLAALRGRGRVAGARLVEAYLDRAATNHLAGAAATQAISGSGALTLTASDFEGVADTLTNP